MWGRQPRARQRFARVAFGLDVMGSLFPAVSAGGGKLVIHGSLSVNRGRQLVRLWGNGVGDVLLVGSGVVKLSGHCPQVYRLQALRRIGT